MVFDGINGINGASNLLASAEEAKRRDSERREVDSKNRLYILSTTPFFCFRSLLLKEFLNLSI